MRKASCMKRWSAVGGGGGRPNERSFLKRRFPVGRGGGGREIKAILRILSAVKDVWDGVSLNCFHFNPPIYADELTRASCEGIFIEGHV